MSSSLILFTLAIVSSYTVSAVPAPIPSPSYPECRKGYGTGYAHYDGWKLIGDDLSGAVPVSPESACVNACNRYGSACAGIFFDASISRCFLKGVHPTTWSFVRGEEDDGTDLIGGCELWSSIVGPEMDAECCNVS
ncbi:hypothetical protein BD324DRAFT_617950 [Kockovaella imperatae]|uniref:Apple domain-containing protein n=1 Tax=Kockovaella imperatae TaxID=4999 RepID=A0A1Y1ULL4_9TREE|nr:hypothetical protein BD324DRAFT_617950 [Kockovaella imperatae]ORX38943.1 hypothetical protein BD324DRAFT_617950 [Kockovaella imperatae]